MKKLIWILIVATLFLSACSRNKIKIVNTDFQDEVSQLQNLTFDFNKELATDSMLNNWDSTEYLNINPQIKGKFKWTAKNQLLFSPSEAFKPCTEYQVKLTKSLTQLTAKKTGINNQIIKFHTPWLNLINANSYWTLENENSTRVFIRVDLVFNYKVDPRQLAGLIDIKVLNKKNDFKIISLENSETVSVLITPPEVNSSETVPVDISINPGLKCFGTEWVTKEIIKKTVNVLPQDQFQISEITSSFEQGKGIVKILTTHPLLRQDIKLFITTDPIIKYEPEYLPNGILLKGDFLEGQTYNIKISGKLKSVFGKDLGQDFSQFVNFGKIEPYISFTDKGCLYLTSKGEKNIGMNIINIPNIKITVFKVFENNLMHYLRQGINYDYYYDDEGGDDYNYHSWESYNNDENFGKIIYTTEISSKSLKKVGNINLLNIDLNKIEYKSNFKGVYLVTVESTEKRWLRDAQLVSVSDIGLIVKQGNNDIMVIANSIYEAKALSGVKINFISKNNQTVYTETTNGKGIAIIDNLKEKIKDYNVSMITARSGDDFNYILFNTSQVETSRYDAGGKRTSNLDYDVFIYGDRNIYRPGDSVYINCVVRKFDWNTENNIPVKIKILLPNGKDYLNFKKQLDREGSVEAKFMLPADIMTGIFSIEVYSGNDVLLNSRKFSVEEFMPDRISVRTKLDKTDYKPGTAVKLSINAMNLFGPPAANRNYDVQMQLNLKDFRLKNFPDYNFNIETDNHITFDETVKEGKTNEEGNATENLLLPDYKNIGIIEGKVFTTVFDETGRPVNRISTFDINTQSYFYGIKKTDYWVNTRQPIQFKFIAVTKEGKLLNNINSKIQISRIFWETVMQRNGNRYSYKSEKRELIVLSRSISLNGANTILPFSPPVSGEYEVAIMTKDGDCRVNYHFYAYGWGDSEFSSFKVSKEGQIEIQADKERYQPGEKAKILFKTPFPAKIIVTIERDKIMENYVLETDNKAASLTLPITADHMPNVYITATAIREMKTGNSPLTVAHGIASIIIEEPNNKLPISITSVEKSRSNSTQNIKVKTVPNAEVTLAVVDEGILQLTSFVTPDIYGYFYGKRALEVTSYDVYAFLYPELKSFVSSMAGDAGSMGKRVNPLTSKRVKLIALWSGILKANSQGECNFKVKIPGFSGSLRIMAVAYKGKQFGSGEKNMKVADPVVISTALPRFMSPKDVVTVPVTLTNTTNKQINAKVTMQLKGELINEGEVSNNIVLKPNAEKMIEFKISAKPQIGICEVKILVNTGKETFFDQTEIAVRPAAGLLKKTDAGGIKGGTSQTLEINTDFLPGTTSCKLIISKSPMVEFSKDLSYLLRYPYGCLEQTISAAFPQLYFRDLAKALNQPQNPNIYNPDYFIQEAIRKVESMQQYNGGFAYWQGGNDISWWSSIYAVNFLYEAKKAGYDVNNSKLENSIKYIEQMVRRKESYSYNYYENGVYKSITTASRENFYSLYFLAMIGRQNLSIMNYYKSNLNQVTIDSRYMLASAYALAGDQFAYRTVLPTEYYSEFRHRMFGGCYASYIRDLAISLYALLNVDQNNPQVGILVRHLSQELKKARWISTQEASFALMALGKFARQAVKSDITGSVTIDGKNAGQIKDNDLIITQNINNKTVKISTTGKGNLYYFYELEGISSSGKYVEEDNYIVIRKAFYDRFGNLLTGNSFSRNDLIIVKLTVYNKEKTSVENVAITDILPACFEIENPRITLGRDYLWIKDKSEPQYIDIRDDRINIFCTVGYNPSHYYYTVRAVSIGSYMMGPVSADAMYNGEYHSIWGGRTVVVK